MTNIQETKAQHTPGPWEITGESKQWVYATYWLDARTTGTKPIAQCKSVECTAAENRANARLIAAAPELLHECEAALRLLEHVYSDRKNKPQVIENVRAAIAKAKAGA